MAESGDELVIDIQQRSQPDSHGEKVSYEISISDNGAGLPEGFDWQTSSNLGLQIVRTLTENELKGSISLKRKGDQTVALLNFVA